MLDCNIKNAVIYARYSSDKQNEQSIEGQISVISKYASDNGYKIIETYIDRAISGRTDERPSFLKMIEDSSDKEFQYVLVYKLDRFSRNRYDSAIYKNKLKGNGVKVISAMENITDTPEGIILESMLEGYSEYYSEELSQKVKRGNRESRKKGQYTGGVCIYGYKIIDKKYYVVESEAKIIKEIFERIARCEKIIDIVNNLNNRLISGPYNKLWTPLRISNIIRNKKYIGITTFKDEVYDNITPAIIDEALFNKVQDIINKHKHPKRANVKYFLSNKMYCAKCGNVFIGKTSGSHDGYSEYHYYVCKNKKNKTCDAKQIKKELIEEVVFNELKEILIDPNKLEELASTMVEYYDSINEESDEIEYLETKIAQTNKKIDNLVKSLEGFESKRVVERITELENEINQTKEKIKSISKDKREILNIEECLIFLNSIKDSILDNELLRDKILTTLVKSIVVDGDILEISLYPSDNIKINIANTYEEIRYLNNIAPNKSLRSPNY